MDDNDLIRRGDALAAIQLGETVTKMQSRILAIPSVDADPVCTDCGGTGITYQTERRCACQPALTPTADGRAEGLREAAEIARNRWQAWSDDDGVTDADGFPAVSCDVTACENIARAILARAAEREGGSHE